MVELSNPSDLGVAGEINEHSSPQKTNVVNADARKSRKAVFRRTIDYNASAINYLKERYWVNQDGDRTMLQSDFLWSPKLCPPKSYMSTPMNCVMSKPVRTSTNKNKCPIYCVCWTPEGRRLITGAFSGEFTLWNGLTFNFETILQAHESQIRCMKWSHNEEWLLTADHSGYVKYWQANMNNVEMYQAHKEPIRGVSFCAFDNKFVTCSDDSTVRIWDFHRCSEERVLRGHGSDVRSVAWHPNLSLIISGSKDAQQPIKLWDPKTGESVSTLYIHKNTCTDVAWNDNGNWFLTASRDHLIKLFDLRNLKAELQTFRGHKRDVMRVAWHPFHECLFASGSADGSIFYWLAGTDTELGAVENAHESMIWSLAWHPFGHILVSGANDFATKFWTRNRPGDVLKEHIAGAGTESLIQATGATHAVTEADSIDHFALSNDILKSLNEANLPNGGVDISEESAFSVNPDEISSVEIPGLNEGLVVDLNVNETDDGDERERNKMRGSRTIPKEFAANWASTRITAMPTVMMPAPNPSQLAAAAAAAAAAVSNFTAAPQYLPPVKPTLPPPGRVHSSNSPNHNATTPDTAQIDQNRPPEDTVREPIESTAHCSNRTTMNYLGQPSPTEPVGPQNADRLGPVVDSHVDRRDHTKKWNGRTSDSFDPSLPPELNIGGAPPPKIRHERHREPFDPPPPHSCPPEQGSFIPPRQDEFRPQRRAEDRDYRDYEHHDRPSRHPVPPDPYHNRPRFPPNNYDGPPRPPMPVNRVGDKMPVADRGRGFPPEVNPRPYEHRPERFLPEDPPYRFSGPGDNSNWERGWKNDGLAPPDRFGYPGQPSHRPPPNRFPPPPLPPPSNDPYRSDPKAHPSNFFPPNKRPVPPPPGGIRPEHIAKYPRSEPHWGGRNQW
ncbi:unnamed protein product [Calicophoron daubneyi]|uniref:Pre-mRNA 3' end processing protein WDR33 n=1 Tax=Calicophoron daubneyi TaxID=300641 RepID=A0AAV2TDY8_CALDB